MEEIFFNFLIISIFTYVLNFLYLKNNFCLDIKKSSYHKRLVGTNPIPLTGGAVILFTTILFTQMSSQIKVFFLLIFLIGLFSDIQKLTSPKNKFLLQIIVTTILIFILDLQIERTKIFVIDGLIEIKIINYFFVLICLLILINGTNFIDGINTNTIGYYLAIYLSLFILKYNNILINSDYIGIIIQLLIVLYLYNFFSKIYLGDSGSFLLGIFTGINLIYICNLNNQISPFYIVLLLWYPAFENLFSIIRKKNINFSPLKPDAKHLHHLIYIFFKKKIKLKKNFSNSFSGMVITFYNIIIFLIGIKYYYHSQILIMLIIINIFNYCFVYIKLLDLLKKSSK